MLYRVEGIVIRSMDYGEGNLIVTLLTKQFGKCSVMARGAKKAKSRHSAVTQLFTHGEYAYFKGGQMGTLNAGELIASHQRLRENLHGSAFAAYMAELTDRMTADNERAPLLYDQLLAGLQAIEDGKDAQIVVFVYELDVLAYAGYDPVLDRCVSCGVVNGEFAVSANQGGVLCARCRHLDGTAVPVSEGALKVMRALRRLDLGRLGKIEVKPQTKAQIKQALRQFYDVHIGLRLKSRSFLDQLEKYEL